ncbi:unnamed protein product [Thelazia callipaeda]|uniref:Prefoldin subunit 5 n=1 Tax=Thelazia callipaeda TaxID=103827 RepID=A0A0N5DA80_THECL|nr:unnamed protein product [Thelazia callipaeda]
MGQVSNERQAIPISDLSVDQLTYLQRQLDQEINFLTESLKELRVFESKFAASEESVDKVNKISKSSEILVPLTESMYIPAKIADPETHLVEIGTGYFVEMSTAKAVDYFRRKQTFLKNQVSFLEIVKLRHSNK